MIILYTEHVLWWLKQVLSTYRTSRSTSSILFTSSSWWVHLCLHYMLIAHHSPSFPVFSSLTFISLDTRNKLYFLTSLKPFHTFCSSVLWSRMCSPSTTIPYSFHVVNMCSSLRCQHRCHFLWEAVIIPLNLSLMSFLFKRLLTCLSLPSNYKLPQGGGSLLFITDSQGLSTMSGISVV